MNRSLFFIICLLPLFICACNIKFDKVKWNEREDIVYPPVYRKQMLNDLTTNYKLIGIKYLNLISLIGEPDIKDTTVSCIWYGIDIHYDMIDPDYDKSLRFTYNKDSVITSYKIITWRK